MSETALDAAVFASLELILVVFLECGGMMLMIAVDHGRVGNSKKSIDFT